MSEDFAKELKELFLKHKVFFSNPVKLTPFDSYKSETLEVSVDDHIDCGNGVTDRSGEFVITSIQRKPEKRERSKHSASFQIIDREKPLGGDYVESPVDGKMYSNRNSYESHLKQKGYHVVDDSRSRTRDKVEKMQSARDEALSAKDVDFAWV